MTDTVNTISLSRDTIKTNIISNMKTYLELEGVDLTKSSFLSFLIDTMSTLTSNLLFYEISVFREFFMTTALSSDAIYNLSSFLGYGPQSASYASCDVLITFPLEFDGDPTFTIPENHRFYAEAIEFATFYLTTITVTNNDTVSAIITKDNGKYNIPTYIDTTSSPGNPTCSILLPTRQYKTITEEFTVDDNIQNDAEAFKFLEKEIIFDGDVTSQQVSNMSVYVTEPGETSPTEYNPPTVNGKDVHSLYLLEYDEKGYVVKKSDDGIKLYFGNGLIGKRPPSFSIIEVDMQITEGLIGNVIAGSITSGDKLYIVDDTQTKAISYTVNNSSRASGGSDGETLEEIRKNSITSITALNRLTSENDYDNIATIAPTLPIIQSTGNIIPILKRSDVQVNEIQLFTPLFFNDEIVPTRNAIYYPTASEVTNGIPSMTEITIDGEIFYTLFNIEDIDLNNKSATYTYVINQLSQSPSLTTHYPNITYDMIATEITSQKIIVDSTAYIDFELKYISSETDTTACSCIMYSTDENDYINMTNLVTGDSNSFITRIRQSLIATGEITYYFIISNPSGDEVVKYSNALIIKEDLVDFMKSNITTDSTSSTIYDIPVIQKLYYDALESPPTDDDPTVAEFELSVMQKIISGMDLIDKRMLNDFINLKFTNTIGNINNMTLNIVNKVAVKSKTQTSIPTSPSNRDRYIINGNEGVLWKDRTNQIAEYSVGSSDWIYTVPKMDDVVYVTDEDKKYVYSVYGWIYPEYTMPFDIEVEIVKTESYTGTSESLRTAISATLLTEVTKLFGNDITLYRSKITDIIHSVSGVSHCRVIQPETNIFFNYELKDLTHQELLEYGPEYIFTDSDHIAITIV